MANLRVKYECGIVYVESQNSSLACHSHFLISLYRKIDRDIVWQPGYLNSGRQIKPLSVCTFRMYCTLYIVFMNRCMQFMMVQENVKGKKTKNKKRWDRQARQESVIARGQDNKHKITGQIPIELKQTRTKAGHYILYCVEFFPYQLLRNSGFNIYVSVCSLC